MTNVHIINNAQNVNSHSQPQLHDGSIVKGRVLSHNGGNSFTVSIAGHKIDVQSSVNLVAGKEFTAKLLVKDNTLNIKLLSQRSSNGSFQKIRGEVFNKDNPLQAKLLLNLGLPVNEAGFRLVQFAMNMGLKLDGTKLRQAYNRSKNTEGKADEEKAQVSLLFDDKNITAGDRAVEKVLGRNQEQNKQGKNRSREDSSPELKKSEEEFQLTDEKTVKSFFESADKAARSSIAGELTVFNTVKGRLSSGHWIILPFEWSFNDSAGVIRVLFDDDEKKLIKTVIDCQNVTSKFKFVIYFKDRLVNSIKMGIERQGVSDSDADLPSLLKDVLIKSGCALQNLNVELLELEQLSGFVPEETEISFVNLKV